MKHIRRVIAKELTKKNMLLLEEKNKNIKNIILLIPLFKNLLIMCLF